MSASKPFLAIVGAIAVILQLVLASAISLGGYVPNFVVVAALALIIVQAEQAHALFAFIMGLVADLVAGTPLGSSSLALVACALVVPLAAENIGNGTAFMSVLLALGASFACQLLSGILLSLAGLFGPVDALIRYILPGTLYTAVLVLILTVLFSRGKTDRPARSGGTTMTNVRFN